MWLARSTSRGAEIGPVRQDTNMRETARVTTGSTPPETPRAGRSRAQDADRRVAARLRERRIMLGMTQQELAEKVGITYQQAHKYETGANRISAGRLAAIAHALGVEPGYFFEGPENAPAAVPTAAQRLLLELARSFAVLPRRQQEVLAEMARALAGAEAGADPELKKVA